MADEIETVVAAKSKRPQPNYEKDENFQKRKRAARRSNNSNAGKPVDFEEAPVTEETSPVEEPAQEATEAETPEAPAEGGIVADAEQELSQAKAAEEAEGETPVEEAAETPAEESAESAPEAEESSEASAEEVAEMPEEPGEYAAPEGESHDELINQYHEAIAYGDVQKANELYKRLQDHRYQENKYRAHKDAVSEAEAREHVNVAKAIVAKHPELGENGIAADKVLALANLYEENGLKPAAALKQAVADLYPEEQPTGTSEKAPVAEEAAPEAPAEMPAMEAAAEEAAPGGAEAGGITPADMEERALKKRAIAEIPVASARNQPVPAEEKPTRTSAIQKMKQARGQ